MQPDILETRPYAPSFIDKFMDFVERLPYPYWLTYLVLFLLESLIVFILTWVVGWQPAFTFNPLVLIFPIWQWGTLTLMTYLDRVSLDALHSFSPLLEMDEKQLKSLKYEFTIMPARNVVLSSVFWCIIYLILTALAFKSIYVDYGLGILLTVVFFIVGLVSFSTGSAIYYHSLRLLRLVNRTVKMVRHFDLFRLDPVYAFSRVTSQIGVSWMVMLTLTVLTYPIQLANAPVLALWAVQVVLAAAAFVLPLWIVNRRLVAEKRRLLAELDRRTGSTIERLHRSFDKNDLGEMDQLNRAMTGLKAERDLLAIIPTWPWRAGTLRGFLSAIVLPILLFIIQLLVKGWLGK